MKLRLCRFLMSFPCRFNIGMTVSFSGIQTVVENIPSLSGSIGTPLHTFNLLYIMPMIRRSDTVIYGMFLSDCMELC